MLHAVLQGIGTCSVSLSVRCFCDETSLAPRSHSMLNQPCVLGATFNGEQWDDRLLFAPYTYLDKRNLNMWNGDAAKPHPLVEEHKLTRWKSQFVLKLEPEHAATGAKNVTIPLV